MLKTVQKNRYQYYHQNHQKQEKSNLRLKTEETVETQSIRRNSISKPQKSSFLRRLNSIRDRSNENKGLDPVSLRESVMRSRRNSITQNFQPQQYRNKRSSSKSQIDQTTSAMKSNLEQKIMQAQIKMEELRLGLKRHHQKKIQIIQNAEKQRLSRSKDKRT